jgi:hypothetical protein
MIIISEETLLTLSFLWSGLPQSRFHIHDHVGFGLVMGRQSIVSLDRLRFAHHRFVHHRFAHHRFTHHRFSHMFAHHGFIHNGSTHRFTPNRFIHYSFTHHRFAHHGFTPNRFIHHRFVHHSHINLSCRPINGHGAIITNHGLIACVLINRLLLNILIPPVQYLIGVLLLPSTSSRSWDCGFGRWWFAVIHRGFSLTKIIRCRMGFKIAPCRFFTWLIFGPIVSEIRDIRERHTKGSYIVVHVGISDQGVLELQTTCMVVIPNYASLYIAIRWIAGIRINI